MAPKMYRGSSDSPKRRDLGSVKRALKTQGSLLLTHKGEGEPAELSTKGPKGTRPRLRGRGEGLTIHMVRAAIRARKRGANQVSVAGRSVNRGRDNTWRYQK